jgi:hypothetical protein
MGPPAKPGGDREDGPLPILTGRGDERRLGMRASIGDRLHFHTNHVGAADHYCRIVEVRGDDGAPPYVVEFPDGHTGLVFPGADAVIEASAPVGAQIPGDRRTRRVHTRAGW